MPYVIVIIFFVTILLGLTVYIILRNQRIRREEIYNEGQNLRGIDLSVDKYTE